MNSNKEFFTHEEMPLADKDRSIQRAIGWPGDPSYKHYITGNLVRNSPITGDDAKRAEVIYGPQLPILQGKMIRPTPPIPQLHPRVALPAPIKLNHKWIDMAIDFFLINGVTFLHTKSRKLNFRTASVVSSWSCAQILQNLKLIFQMYQVRGFKIQSIDGDDEFDIEELHNFFPRVTFNIVAANAHIGFIEESICVIKEQVRCTTYSLPFTCYPKIMIRYIVKWILRNLNAFPSKNGISETMSPAMLVHGQPQLDLSVPMLAYGTFIMTFTQSDNTQME